MKSLSKLIIAGLTLQALSSQASALTFTLVDTGGAAPGSQAYQGFQEAANLWSSAFSDPVDVTLQIGFSNLGQSTLAQAGSNRVYVSMANALSALAWDATTSNDVAFYNSVAPSIYGNSGYMGFLRNDPSGQLVWDNNYSTDNYFLSVPVANARAAGLFQPAGGAVDAAISFNSSFNFDFNGADGIAGGSIDFVGVAAHEIGHALGFVSGVDMVDIYSGWGPGAGQLNFDTFPYATPLDLMRFNANVGPGWHNLSTGGLGYLSLDGGGSTFGYMSTGQYNGNGWQASHWLDGWGLMDPNLNMGELGVLQARDLMALDVIGWNLNVPEASLNGLWEIF